MKTPDDCKRCKKEQEVNKKEQEVNKDFLELTNNVKGKILTNYKNNDIKK